jgi:hypothetical protein
MSDRSPYAGMTVNERLFEAGLVEAFKTAARARNRSEMIRILSDVDVEDAAWSADTILKQPDKYGF